jgi:CPA2 family monovalent cation:H+ antiporter-2
MDKIHVPYLIEMLILLSAAVTIAPLFKRFKLSPVLAYLLAGSLIGPYALGYVNDIEAVQNVSELGVIFLLFLVGLELPLERLKVMRKFVFGLGAAQVLCTSFVIASICIMFGLPTSTSVVLGGALALSSTALVIQLLSERHELNSRYGRKSFAILLFQDLAVVPLLAMTMILGSDNEGASVLWTLVTAFAKAIAAIIFIVLFGRYALRPLYKYFASAKNNEIFTAASLLIVLGISTVTGMMGLSMALGAFLAGMMLAETEYRHQVEINILPFSGLLLGLFFMSIGMTIDYSLIADKAAQITLMVLGLMVLKALIIIALTYAFGLDIPLALRTGVMLSQGGEFAFVVTKVAMTGGVFTEELGQTVLIVVALSMAVTPLFIAIVAKLTSHAVAQSNNSVVLDTIASDTHGMKNHVIIAGFGRVGKTVAALLEKQNIPYLVVDADTKQVSEASEQGLPVYYGNACNVALLEAIGADRAVLAVITLDSAALSRKTLEVLKTHFPHVQVFMRGKNAADCADLESLGATFAVSEASNASVVLGQQVVKVLQGGGVTGAVDALKDPAPVLS